MLRRRRPLLRAAMVGGAGYTAGRNVAERRGSRPRKMRRWTSFNELYRPRMPLTIRIRPPLLIRVSEPMRWPNSRGYSIRGS